jgi:two-component system, chemotaxis family, chemotaxis protein CheY
VNAVGSTPRLLAIDDNSDSAELIARVASKCGYEARAIVDARDLSEIIGDWNPDVLTLDLCMPDDDGVSVISMLKRSGFRGRLIIVSGQDGWLRKTASRLAEAHGLEIVDDLAKPIEVQSLRDLLGKLKAA